ncbi:MAG TPA: hypothetical protein VF841_04590 [Anaeromyxobacter sp.]
MTMRALALTCALAGISACDRDEVTHFRVAKAPAATPAMPAGMDAAADVAPPGRPPGGGLRWTLPKGWSETQGGSMRYASFKIPVEGTVDASVVVLPGPAGGELANVNRWRGQIGLEPLDEAALAAARKTVATKAGPLKVYDFASGGASGKRLVAGLTEIEGNTWFVKLTGDAGAVGAARGDFMKLLGSLRVDESR